MCRFSQPLIDLVYGLHPKFKQRNKRWRLHDGRQPRKQQLKLGAVSEWHHSLRVLHLSRDEFLSPRLLGPARLTGFSDLVRRQRLFGVSAHLQHLQYQQLQRPSGVENHLQLIHDFVESRKYGSYTSLHKRQ